MAPIGARGAIDHILERNMPKTWLLAGVMLASIAGVAHAQDVAKRLTLDRVFGEPSLAGPSLRGLKLSPDGTLVPLLKARPDAQERYDQWALDNATSGERMLGASKKIGTRAELFEAEQKRRGATSIGGARGRGHHEGA